MWDNCSLFTAVHRNVIRKRRILRNMELSESRKSDNFGKSSTFPGIPAGNFSDRRFPWMPVWGVALCDASQGPYILYNGGPPFRPSRPPLQNCSFPWGIWTPPNSNTWFLGPARAHNPNGTSIGSFVFAGFTTVTERQTQTNRQTDQQTDRQTTLGLLGL